MDVLLTSPDAVFPLSLEEASLPFLGSVDAFLLDVFFSFDLEPGREFLPPPR